MAGKRGARRGARLELALLGLAGVALAAFAVSFVVGLGPAGASGDPRALSPAAHDGPIETDPWQDEDGDGGARHALRVEVLNGSGRPGLAREGTQALREAGVDVVYFGNAARFDHSTSVVLHRRGDVDATRRLAARAGIQEVREAPDSSLLVDASVILGADWRPPVAGAERAGDGYGTLEKAKMRLLRWLGWEGS